MYFWVKMNDNFGVFEVFIKELFEKKRNVFWVYIIFSIYFVFWWDLFNYIVCYLSEIKEYCLKLISY